GDIDLLVHGHDLERADELLRGMRDARHAIPFVGHEGICLLDVRADICSPGGAADRPGAAVRIPIEGFWKRARPAQIESVATLVFSPEDLLLHLALHLATRLSEADRFVGHVTTLCDIGETCRRYANAIDWSRFLTQAKAY